MPIRIGKCKNNGRHYKCNEKCLNRKQSITEIIEDLRTDFCNNYCKYADECEDRAEEGKEPMPCPLDRL